MSLPLAPPLPTADALSVNHIPEGAGWRYEPKWDGFRCIAFREGDEVYLQSKGEKPLSRYFPDVVAELQRLKGRRCILDGELVVPVENRLSFEELQLRLHPAASRVHKLAQGRPALFVIFDLLADERGRSLLDKPFDERRARLERFFARNVPGDVRLALSPSSAEPAVARRWFRATGDGLDGIIAKRADAAYAAGERTAMQKIKNIRSADCVVGGFRYARRQKTVGSLLLGLYDDEDLLHHVGFTSSFGSEDRGALTRRLEQLERRKGRPRGFTGRSPGGPSRWRREVTGEFNALPHELVVEITYDHFSGGRFRHATGFVRWRPDKATRQCRMDEVVASGAQTLRLLE
jgi:ATP-dependent DNA ligase